MALASLEAYDSIAGVDNRTRATTEDLVNKMDASTIDNKIDFFRFIGLEISKVCDMNYNTNNDNNNNNNKHKNNNNTKAQDVHATSKSPCISSSIISNTNYNDIPVKSFTCQSKSKLHHKYNKREISHSGDMVDSRKIVELMRECRVVIRGEKCRVCGKSFKCINDVQIHNKKKHRRKRSRTKVVLKIGNEVISTVPIRRKYLKRAAHQYDDRTIVNSDDIDSFNEQISSNDRIRVQRENSYIDLDDISDIENDESSLTKIIDRDLILSPLGDSHIHEDEQSQNDDDDEDIREVLRITRSRKSVSSINHETPNRTERELLLSDAIREFDRLDNDPMDILEFAENDEVLRDESNDVEDCNWHADGTLENRHLDLVENNCSFHIQNDYDIDFSLESVNSLSRGFDMNYFDDENNLLRSNKEYRKEKNDLPDFIDYAHSWEDNNASLNNNNNKVCGLGSPFHNEAMINEWNELARVPKSINCDNRQCAITRNVDTSVLIKEEIILDDLL